MLSKIFIQIREKLLFVYNDMKPLIVHTERWVYCTVWCCWLGKTIKTTSNKIMYGNKTQILWLKFIVKIVMYRN